MFRNILPPGLLIFFTFFSRFCPADLCRTAISPEVAPVQCFIAPFRQNFAQERMKLEPKASLIG